MKKDFFEIGAIIKTHGIHGELILEAKNSELIENIGESVFLEIEGLLVPFFIAELKATSKERFRIKFDWIESETQAKKLNNCPVYIPLNTITASNIDLEENFDLLVGFMVSDTNYGLLGEINYVVENSNNPLLSLNYKNTEILIPIHPDFIKDINTDAKSITMECPEGLIDLYLE